MSTSSEPMTTSISLRNPTRPIHAGVILMGGTTEILDIAPIDLLNGITPAAVAIFPDGVVSPDLKKQAVDIQFHYVSENGGKAKVTSGMRVDVTDTFETCPPLDIVLIGATLDNYQPNENELNFLRKTFKSPTCQAFLTICGGMMPPLQAGLLQGLRATAPRPMLPQLRKDAPGTTWTERRWERDGKMWTSGTLLNGTDMMSEWAASVWGRDLQKDLMGVVLEFGGWPVRDVGYQDDDMRLGGWVPGGINVDVDGAEVDVKG